MDKAGEQNKSRCPVPESETFASCRSPLFRECCRDSSSRNYQSLSEQRAAGDRAGTHAVSQDDVSLAAGFPAKYIRGDLEYGPRLASSLLQDRVTVCCCVLSGITASCGRMGQGLHVVDKSTEGRRTAVFASRLVLLACPRLKHDEMEASCNPSRRRSVDAECIAVSDSSATTPRLMVPLDHAADQARLV